MSSLVATSPHRAVYTPTPSGSTPKVSSSMRRKPQITYKSPTSNDPPLLPPPTPAPNPASVGKTPTPSFAVPIYPLPKRKIYPMAPPLPLYHPLGRLALSLPLLDPSSLGLSPPSSYRREDDATRRSSVRPRRPAAKLRDTEEEALPPTPPITTLSIGNSANGGVNHNNNNANNNNGNNNSASAATVVAPTTRDSRERASPRKRRAAAGGGKRKRKEVDDGDATYPAKRTRIPRGAANQVAEEGSPVESVDPGNDVTNSAEIANARTSEPIAEEKKPERRSTRSAAKRRDSSASEATSQSVSVVANGTRSVSRVKDSEAMDVDKKSDLDEHVARGSADSVEKEDGELSEEGAPQP